MSGRGNRRCLVVDGAAAAVVVVVAVVLVVLVVVGSVVTTTAVSGSIAFKYLHRFLPSKLLAEHHAQA